MSLEAILQQYWGHSSFRPGQRDIIDSVLSGKDTLALLPTGGGKSVCYQVPAMQLPGLCLVISPLIALMKDQVENLRKKNITAFAIYSGLSRKEVISTLETAGQSNCKFLYVSPERLETSLFHEYLPSLNIQLIAVDEAHCISQWGYDFRPPYLRIAELRKELPNVPILALTASATPTIQQDICDKLGFFSPAIFQQSFERSNLSYSVFNVDVAIPKISEILHKVKGSSIIYCRSRKRTQEIAELLQAQGINASWYHAGLSAEEREQRQEAWKENRSPVIVCTNAFGMGIDKPDVRTVIHAGIPDCLENYYQEAGRAGRDGRKAYAVLLYTTKEIKELQELSAQRFPSIKEIQEVYQAVVNYLQLPVGTGEGQYFDFDFSEFARRFNLKGHSTLNALKALEQEGWLQFNEQVFIPPQVQITASREELQELENTNPLLDGICKMLLRSYEGIYNRLVTVPEKQLAYLLRKELSEVKKNLQALQLLGIIRYQPQKDNPQVYFPIPRIKAEDLRIDIIKYNERKKQYEERIQAMLHYVEEHAACRSKILATYFGDNQAKPCGICDNCLAQKSLTLSDEEFENIRYRIINIIKYESLPAAKLLQQLSGIGKKKAWKVIDYLQAEEIITMNRDGVIRLN
jgi:ATP-dependent DNA helicase RecQ